MTHISGWQGWFNFNRTTEEPFTLESLESTTDKILNCLYDGILITDLSGRVLYMNKASESLTGFDFRDAKGMFFVDVLPLKESFKPYAEESSESLSGDDSVYFESIVVNSGELKYIEKSVTPLLHDKGKVAGFVWRLRDVSHSVHTQEELLEAAKVFQSSLEGIVILSPSGIFLRVNEAFSRLTGYHDDEVLGRSHLMLRSGRHDTNFYNDIYKEVGKFGFWHGELWQRRKNGEVYPEWMSITAVKNKHGRISRFVAIFSDITEQKTAEERIHKLAYYDSLTGLPNRTLFIDRLRRAMVHATRNRTCVALLFLDLDRFKAVNDSMGHPAGDRLIFLTAERLLETVRHDDTVARMGGDEFTIIMGDIKSHHEAVKATSLVAEKICQKLSMPFIIEGREVVVSCSLGIALFPEDAEDDVSLVRNADTAMYHAKAQGKNRFQFFAEKMNAEAMERLDLEEHLREACEKDEFELYYQPQINLKTGELFGLEALLRWCNKDYGNISPAQFIPVAEETGLITTIGEEVLRKACVQGKKWLDKGIDFGQLGVNVSVRQMLDKHFLSTVEFIVEESGFSYDRLNFELTESCLIEDVDKMIDILNHFKRLGISVSIDDFGTGYSSLSYLKRLPIDTLKIDRAFIADMCEITDGAEIANAVIAMGHALKLDVVAEGVETEEQLLKLQSQGCDYAQGYLFSKALPVDALEPLLLKPKESFM